MRVACIGNMNNNFFALSRYLRDNGIEADLLLTTEQPHFLPENDTFRIKEYSWIKEIKNFPWPNQPEIKLSFLSNFLIKRNLKKYDFIIGCGYAPSLLNYFGIQLDLFIPYGSDFYIVPFEKIRNFGKSSYYRNYAKYQMQGIIDAKRIMCDHVPIIEEIVKDIPISGERVKSFIPCIYSVDFNALSIKQYYKISKFYDRLNILRKQNEFIVLQQVRQTWKTNQDGITNKGNDKLLEGFSYLKKRNPSTKSHLILFEYGEDVVASKKLIEELGFSGSVTWLPISARKEIMIAISIADVCVGELYDSFFLYGSVVEFLSMSKPFIHSCNWNDFKEYYSSSYPINFATSSEEVYMHLDRFSKDKDEAKRVGEEGYSWFKTNAIDAPLSKIIGYIKEKRIR